MNDPIGDPIPDLALLRKAVEWAEHEDLKARTTPEISEWSQNSWRAAYSKHDQAVRESCKTSYCIAGYVCQITEGNWVGLSDMLYAKDYDDPDYVMRNQSRPTIHARYRAQRLLGLTTWEAARLFDGANKINDVKQVASGIAFRAGEVWE